MKRFFAAVLLVLTACSGGDAGPPPTAAPTTAPLGSSTLPYFLPAFLPVGFAIINGAVLPEGAPTPAFAVALGRPAAQGTVFTDVVLATLRQVPGDREVGPNQRAAIKPVDINGTQARLLESGVVGVSVDWFSNGVAVGVSGPLGASATVVDVARRLRVGTSVADSALTSPPSGYSVIAEARFEDREPEETQTLRVQSERGQAISITATRTSLPLVFVASGGDTVRPRKVRGKDALVSTRVRQLESGNVIQSTVAWYEHDGVAIAITGSVPADTVVAVAEGLATVTESDWRDALPS